MAFATSGVPNIKVTGRLGGIVLQKYGGRLVARAYVKPRDPRTPKQQAARRRMDLVGIYWKGLDDDARDAWEAYAEGDPAGTYRVFLGLTARWLRMYPGGTPPSLPPAGPFAGDAPTLRIVEGAGGPGLTVEASQGNAPHVATEILAQRLASKSSKPRGRDWTTGAFLTFTPEGLAQAVPLKKGAWALLYRFVRTDTAQASPSFPLGKAVVA